MTDRWTQMSVSVLRSVALQMWLRVDMNTEACPCQETLPASVCCCVSCHTMCQGDVQCQTPCLSFITSLLQSLILPVSPGHNHFIYLIPVSAFALSCFQTHFPILQYTPEIYYWPIRIHCLFQLLQSVIFTLLLLCIKSIYFTLETLNLYIQQSISPLGDATRNMRRPLFYLLFSARQSITVQMLISSGGGHSFVFEIKVFNHLNSPIDKAVKITGNNIIYLLRIVGLMLPA